ncbi:MAG: GNAT family N-acetyltransferase [Treponema sp.]|nr:GNAT family N-acetyltransferase [Treponema sp.]
MDNRNGLLIRIADMNDIKSLSRLYEEFFKYNSSQQPFSCAEAEENGDYPQSVIEGTTGDIFVSEIDNVIVGFIHLEEDKTDPFPCVVQRKFTRIIDLYIKPEYRKNGIGKLLIEKAKEWSVNRKHDYLELMVLDNNEIGKNFYKKENFVTTSNTMRYIL